MYSVCGLCLVQVVVVGDTVLSHPKDITHEKKTTIKESSRKSKNCSKCVK